MAKKKPDVLELPVGGSDTNAKISYAESVLGKEINIKDVFKSGEFIDASAVTLGHGYTGSVKRFGIKIQKRKDKQMNRHVGSIGSTVPRKVDWRVPMPGQHGFHSRTELNKRIVSAGDDVEKVNPSGGFVGYGIIPNNYTLIEGSVPGCNKRLVILKKSSRPLKDAAVDMKNISITSKQGV